MCEVDLADQQTQYCVTLHEMLEWWKKLFLPNLIDVSVVNAKIIYKELPVSVNKCVRTEKFCLKIIEGLLEGYDPKTILSTNQFLIFNPGWQWDIFQHWILKWLMVAEGLSNPDCEVCSNRTVMPSNSVFLCRMSKNNVFWAVSHLERLQNWLFSCSA